MLIWLMYKLLKEKCWNETSEKKKQEHGNTETYKIDNSVFNSRKSSGIVLISLLLNSLKKEIGMRRMKTKETRKRKHKDLQVGQFDVIVEEAKLNRADIVIV